jgi:hypothetical protein
MDTKTKKIIEIHYILVWGWGRDEDGHSKIDKTLAK